jgi:hypothetical protein
MSKRQGSIAAITDTAEIASMKMATEEAITIQYMLRALGVPARDRTTIRGKNMGSLITTDNPGSTCTKTHSQVAFHYVRECSATEITDVLKVDTANNFSDPFTKALGTTHFLDLFQHIYRSLANVIWLQQEEKKHLHGIRFYATIYSEVFITPFILLP